MEVQQFIRIHVLSFRRCTEQGYVETLSGRRIPVPSARAQSDAKVISIPLYLSQDMTVPRQ